MKDTPTTANIVDFRKRYEGSYGRYDGRIPVKIHRVTSQAVEFRDISGGVYFANVGAGVSFTFEPVFTGYVHTEDNHCYFVARIPARQWHRGIHNENTEIVGIDREGNTIQVPFSDSVFNVMTNYITPTESVSRYNAGTSDVCAPSKHFCVVRHGGVYFRNILMAKPYAVNDVFTLSTPGKEFQQELQDAINRTNLRIKLV